MREVQLKMTRLEGLQKKQVNGERFVTGALMIEAARTDPVVRDMLLMLFDRTELRPMDQRRVEPLIGELRNLPADPDSAASPPSGGAARDPRLVDAEGAAPAPERAHDGPLIPMAGQDSAPGDAADRLPARGE
jgi:hypothetical protein